MIIRSYTGRTVPEALEKVKTDMGDTALIIETRSVREPGLLGRKSGYEVVAAVDDLPGEKKASNRLTRAYGAAAETGESSHAASTESASHQASRLRRETHSVAEPVVPVQPVLERSGIDDELAAIRRQLARLAAGQGTPVGHLGDELAKHLEDIELPADHIAELDAAVASAGPRLDADKRWEFCSLLLARQLSCAGAIDWTACRRLMLVGPTLIQKVFQMIVNDLN